MTSTSEGPLLFLDIDGPLIPFGSSTGRQEVSDGYVPTPLDQGNPLLARLDPGVGARLMALGCRLVLATTWMEEANEIVAPRIGLPRLHVVAWPDTGTDQGPQGLHWKTGPLVEWANGRPFVWVDDEISGMDRQWVAACHPGPSLLHQVDPTKGLRDADFSAITEWLDAAAPG